MLDGEGVAYGEVDITGDPALEAAYREWLPVVEIDGERAFVYRIPRRRRCVANWPHKVDVEVNGAPLASRGRMRRVCHKRRYKEQAWPIG